MNKKKKEKKQNEKIVKSINNNIRSSVRKLNPILRGIVGKKVDKFKEKSHKPTSAFYLTRGKKNKFTSVGKVIYSKIRTFKGKTNPRKMKAYKQGNISKPYSTKDVIKHIGGIDNAKCYLTGKKLNLHDSYSWQLDHIIPRTKGGSNDLDNMGATTREVNMSKNAMTLEEYHQLCKDVLEHAGYSVIPPKN